MDRVVNHSKTSVPGSASRLIPSPSHANTLYDRPVTPSRVNCLSTKARPHSAYRGSRVRHAWAHNCATEVLGQGIHYWIALPGAAHKEDNVGEQVMIPPRRNRLVDNASAEHHRVARLAQRRVSGTHRAGPRARAQCLDSLESHDHRNDGFASEHRQLYPTNSIHYGCVARAALPFVVERWDYQWWQCRAHHDKAHAALVVAMAVYERASTTTRPGERLVWCSVCPRALRSSGLSRI
jgi:hypothetical protein